MDSGGVRFDSWLRNWLIFVIFLSSGADEEYGQSNGFHLNNPHIYCDVLPSNASVISGFWIQYSDLLDTCLAELQLIITLSILLYSHCVNSSVLLLPIRCLVRVLLPRLLSNHHWTKTVTAFTSQLELAENYFELNWLHAGSYWTVCGYS
jgi:hypothetical protein